MAGTYYIGVVVDADDEIDESDESNNATISAPSIGLAPGLPDLRALSVAGPASGSAGASIPVSIQLDNGGDGPAAGSWLVRLYLSTNTIISLQDILVHEYTNTTSIGAGSANNQTITVHLPSGLASGLYFWGLMVNPDGALSETDYGNNLASGEDAIVVGGPAPVALTNGVVLSSLVGSQGTSTYYRIDLPSGVSQFNVTTSGGTGDADLTVIQGSAGPSSSSGCSSLGGGNSESCTFNTPGAGAWYIRLYAYSDYAGVFLIASHQ